MSFRLKTILGVALIEAVLLGFLITSGTNLIKQMGGAEIEREAHASVQLFAALVQDAVLATDLASLEGMVKVVAKSPGVVYARVLGQEDIILAASDNRGAQSRLKFVEDTDFASETNGVFDVAAPIVAAHTAYGRVELGMSTAKLKESLADAKHKGSMIALLNMLLTALFSFLLGTYLTRQLRSLKAASLAVASGEVGRQIPVKGKDELAEAASAFNSMSSRIKVSLDNLAVALRKESDLSSELKIRERHLLDQGQVLDAIASVQSLYIKEVDEKVLFTQLLDTVLDITASNFGFIAEVCMSEANQPYLKLQALTNIAWDEASRALYERYQQAGGAIEFHNLNTLFGAVLLTRKMVVSNDPAHDERSGGFPAEHPVLDAFLGVPLFAGPEMVGMVGVANREGGYDAAFIERLTPLFNTLGQIAQAYRNDRERQQTLLSLTESQSRLAAVLDTAVDGIITLDEQGIVDSYNPAAQTLFGYRPEEVIGKNVKMLMPAPLVEEYGAHLDRYLRTGIARISGVGRELLAQHKDGSFFPIELSVAEMKIGGERHFSGIVRDISERARREQLLQKTTGLQQAILNGASYAIISTDLTGLIQTVNAAAERMIGYRAGELIGHASPLLFHDAAELQARASELSGELLEAVSSDFEALVAKVRRVGVEEREWSYLHRNSYRVPVLVSVSCLRDSGGNLTGFLSIAMDITERKASEQLLHENEMRKSAITESALDCIVVMDHVGRVVEFNPAAEQTFGYSKDAVIGSELAELIIPAPYREMHRKGLAKFNVTGETKVIGKRIEISAMRADGTEFPVELAISAISVNGQPLFTAYLRDISETKAAQEKLRRFSSELNAIFNLSPDGFVAFDGDGVCAYANPAFSAMTGLSRDHVKGVTLEQFDAALEGLRELKSPYRSPQALGDGEIAVLTLIRPRPSIIQISVRFLKDSEHGGRIFYFRNVTHETEVDRMKSEFLSTAAHELRTPMASIHGFSELLLTRKFDEATQRDLMETIHRQSSNLVRLVTELLDLARIEARAGKDFNIMLQPLQPIVESTVSGFKVPEGPYTLAMSLPSKPILVAVDAEKMSQALLNLLSNAYKYSPNGGEINVSIDSREHGGKVEVGIHIKDHGLGLTPKQQEHVFERFYRADTSGAIPGTGLGLSLVKEIVELHHGSIEVKSALGEGTEMTCWLPLAEGAATISEERSAK